MKEEMERDGSLEQFKLEVREQKCVTKLLETAKITEVEAKVTPAKAKPVKAEHPKHKKAAEKPAEKPSHKDTAVKKHTAKASSEEKPIKKSKATPRKKKT